MKSGRYAVPTCKDSEMTFRKIRLSFLASLIIVLSSFALGAIPPQFEITYAPAVHAAPLTGRLILVLAQKASPEPRYQVGLNGAEILGIDVSNWQPGRATVIDSKVRGYPRELADLPEGDYYAQAVLNVYTELHRSDGHTIWVAINDGRQATFQIAAGNLYSDPVPIHIGNSGISRLELNHVIPAPPAPQDTEWVKHVRIQSQKLTQFWGHPIYVHATVLLPKGYADHPNVRYPSVYTMGHDVPFSFSTKPDTEAEKKAEAERGLETGYEFYQQWDSDNFPRFIAISFEQQTPFFPDSYSVNSANNGPYGDAIIEEVIPYLEEHFRMIRSGYARVIEGASTGGWQTLALQLQHPDFFGGAWVLQPDPIDFHRYQLVDAYKDDNAFATPSGPFTTAERPMRRSPIGQVNTTVRELSRMEDVLGSHGRSQYQFEGWEAVYGPVGEDGYPKALWDKETGKIDHEVANYMRDHGFDLLEYTRRNWPTLGPKLVGKLHFSCGDMDHFYLNLAVYNYQQFLQSTANPHYEGDFIFGRPMKGHSYHPFHWAEFVRRMAAEVKKNTPAGENSSVWNY